MENLASRYKALLALLPVLALIALATGVVPLADGVAFAPIAYSLLGMTVAFLLSDTADSNLFAKMVVKYLATLDLESEQLEAELDSLDAILTAHPVGLASQLPIDSTDGLQQPKG